MKLNVLKAALEHYMLSADCSEADRKEAISALASCERVAERYRSSDIWSNDCYVVTADSMSNLLNMTTYDVYGRAHKLHGDGMNFRYYAAAVRSDTLLDELTDEQLELGYDIISDLWADNEALGDNNDDGTYRK